MSGRLRLLFIVFAALVIAPAAVFLRYARSLVSAEEARESAEALSERARAAAAVETEVRSAIARVEAIELKRPWYHYRNHYVSPDLTSNVVAFDRSPLYPAPSDPSVEAYFEWTPGAAHLASPSEGIAASDADEATLAATSTAHVRELEPLALPLLTTLASRPDTIFGDPVAEEVTSKILISCHLNPTAKIAEIDVAQKGDVPTQKKLESEWMQHQAVQGKARQIYAQEKLNANRNPDSNDAGSGRSGIPSGSASRSMGSMPQRQEENAPQQQIAQQNFNYDLGQKVHAEEPLAATVRTWGFRYHWLRAPNGSTDAKGPPDLVAVRLVDLDGVRVLQGYELDVEQLWSLASASLAWHGLQYDGWLDLATDAADVIVVHTSPVAPVSAAASRFSSTRLLLYGSAGLLLFLATAGLAALHGIVRGQVDLAARRTDFVAAVSHELKAPLTAIRALAEMLTLGIVPDRAKELEYFGHIQAESERLSRLVANVLDLSRIERRERSYELTRGDLGGLVRALAEAFRPHVVAQGFAFDVSIDEDLPAVRLDRDALSQALANLLDNAVKYTLPCKTKRVALRARRFSAVEVVVEVEDSGIGIEADDRQRLFQRFARGSSPLARGTGGAGLGLSIAREHVAAHGGRIELESAPGKGSTFRVVLPAAPD